jgi:hypothetical protein
MPRLNDICRGIGATLGPCLYCHDIDPGVDGLRSIPDQLGAALENALVP